MKKLLAILFVAIMIYVVPHLDDWQGQPSSSKPASTTIDYTLEFPADRYPETAKHIREAMASGESKICTIDREEAEENRKESLKDIPTKKGYDRDEWPMAMCKEGGEGADIEYISPSDNRGAGAWVSNQLDTFPDGTRVEFIVK
ncbi:NucA/NucB deoxyribonuclease domain-containing protein [Paenibacillus sp. MMO-177]|uniref:NucA/NucB deoxyribonuclease domain-containing protein n=1 Tax=Paenibacillus sp. MMO-177 TaxID=3081289 RepID=UPI003FA74C6E